MQLVRITALLTLVALCLVTITGVGGVFPEAHQAAEVLVHVDDSSGEDNQSDAQQSKGLDQGLNASLSGSYTGPLGMVQGHFPYRSQGPPGVLISA